MIRKIHLEAYKGLSTVKDIDFTETSIPYLVITGDGGTGKSSLLGFIRGVLSGTVADSDINNLVNKAAGEIVFEKGGRQWKATLSKTRKTETLRLWVYDDSLNQWLVKGGVKAIRELVGEIYMDPFAWQRMKLPEQVRWYKEVCKIDTTQFDDSIKALSEERLLVGRRRTDLAGVANVEGTQDIEAKAKLYEHPKDFNILTQRQQELQQKKNEVNAAANRIADNEVKIKEANVEIKRLEDLIISQKAKIEAANSSIEKANELIQMFNMASVSDELSKIEVEIKDIQQFNNERTQFLSVLEKIREYTQKDTEYKQLSDKIEETRAAKDQYIAKQKIDIPGFELKPNAKGEDELFYNDISLSGLSHTEVVTLTMLIQNKINPNIEPLLIIDEFETIGSSGVEVIEQLAASVPGIKIFLATMDRNEKTLKIEMREKL